MKFSAFAAMALFLLATSGVSAAGPTPGACLRGLVSALNAGSFSGSTDCRRDRLLIAEVGRLRFGAHHLEVYAYRYRLRPPCRDCAVHGGQRIIVLRDGRYAGQYGVLDYRTRVAMRGADLILSPATGDGSAPRSSAVVRFSRSGPPNQILFDGERIAFFR